ALALHEGERVGRFVVELGSDRGAVGGGAGGYAGGVGDGGVELVHADGLGGKLDALDVWAGLKGDALGGFAAGQRNKLAVVGDRKIALNVLIVLVAEVDV